MSEPSTQWRTQGAQSMKEGGGGRGNVQTFGIES